MTKPHHPDHQRLTEWYSGSFDPDDLNLPVISSRIGELAGDEPPAGPDMPKAADGHVEGSYGKCGTAGTMLQRI